MGNGPEAVSSIIGNLLRDMGSQDLLKLADINRRWGEIVGEVLAARVRPLKIQAGTLYLSTSSPVWSQEILFAREMIKERIKEVVGSDIEQIRTVQTPYDNDPEVEQRDEGAPESPPRAEANRDALATLQRARESYERAKAKERRR